MRLYLIRHSADIARVLLDMDVACSVRDLIEATVRLPARGHQWVAVFTGPEPGQQVWRSTGLRDYDAALALARTWEAQARAQRMARQMGRRSAALRVGRRPQDQSSGPFPEAGPLSQVEIAAILKMSERAVRQTEKRALAKLGANPLLRRLWREYLSGELGEGLSPGEGRVDDLSDLEVRALLALARSPLEWQAMHRVLDFIGAEPKPFAPGGDHESSAQFKPVTHK